MAKKAIPESKKTEASISVMKNESRKALRQTELPKISLEEALQVPMAIWEQFAGSATQPIYVAEAVGISPTSSNWRKISCASAAYGLTEGGYNSKEISLTELGRRVVAPTEENDDKLALFQAAQIPQFFKMFYEKYGNSNKLPQPNIASNLLVSWGVPAGDANAAFDLITKNGEFSGIIVNIKGNKYVNITPPKSFSKVETSEDAIDFDDEICEEIPEELLKNMNIDSSPSPVIKESVDTIQSNNKVFISHGKNRQVVDQLKQLLEFGAFEPVVSVEREATAISVPDKVFNDMRICGAGVIHIEEERKLLDSEGKEYTLINENVLIEIGAAIALFNNRVILLCNKGIQLPSNLQGLYRCEYEGEQLDYQATMKLLKTFSEFRKA